jgi:2-oxoglutarate dehydrogenase E1 component
VSQAGANTPANHFGGSFGPNEWLVQEMYEKFQSDPSSVDKAWWDFFADFKGTPSLNGSTNSNPTKPGVPPIPKSQLAKTITEPQTAIDSKSTCN